MASGGLQAKKTPLPPLTVETLVNGGAGLAHHDGRVVFIPHTAVGDRVEACLVRVKKHYSEAQLVNIIQPGEERRVPPCPVAGDCGGCQWQHLDYSDQLKWKQRLFTETLTHQCNVAEGVIQPICAADDAWRYRSRAQIKCYVTEAGFISGFYRSKSRFVIAVEDCLIVASRLNELLSKLRQLLRYSSFANKIPQIDLATDDNGKCASTVHYLGHDLEGLAELLRSAELDADILIQSGRKKSLKAIQGDGILQLQVDQGQITLNYAVGSFAQINLSQNRRLIDSVIRLAALEGHERVLDLYCGMGNFSLPLARRAATVTGIEEAPSSIAWARKNAALNQINNTRFVCDPVEKHLPRGGTDQKVDLLVLDPPRTGAYALMKALIAWPVRRIVYVSCDQQTLARDLRLLVNHGYRLTTSQPFDMFPQTYHCESVTLLERS
ncbi:MAG: 23S rRNA (uracil(1939)-C(5))-methyltransferase RlmD [Desulfuromonadales bacterium]|nr:23S rRNA (uracil(1939)-C(5))-methyltransferase RlmD [Desulfuromonadales bacterium]MBN2792381.1 23S rRNA (uracil(1939)-C(5))-methyltransferase RlmD [Desulfuromonadales bacterium]